MVYTLVNLCELFLGRQIAGFLAWVPGCVRVGTCTVEDGESAGNVDTTTQMNSDGVFIEDLYCHFHERYASHDPLFQDSML